MDTKDIVDSLSVNELKILPHLEERDIVDICKKSNLDKTSVLRALEYLKIKGVVELNYKKTKIVDLDTNGILHQKNGLPERRLLNVINEKRIINLQEAQKQSRLSDEEFKISIGTLRRKNIIDIKNQNLVLNNSGGFGASKKTDEELFLDSLPIKLDSIPKEQINVFRDLQRRKEIVKIKEETEIEIKIKEFGKKILNLKIDSGDLIEQVTPEMIQNEKLWKGKRFRKYNIQAPLPEISGGKRHFVNQAIDYAKKIWIEMGFQEMRGDIINSSFWVFDSLFTAQDHPVREMQDTFFISKKSELPDKKLVDSVKMAHEQGIAGSKGWRYSWDSEEAKKTVLRTHTTCISAKKLYELSKLPIQQRKGKFFSLDKNFRNETVDWKHGFEFYQSEGIVVDENVNLRHLLGYLTEFYKRMGFEKIRFLPTYYPYTEPSVQIRAWHPERKIWFELGGAGIFRPEIAVPLLGKNIPILAWGQGFDRIIMDYYQIKDLRELYKNDLEQLRKTKFWMKS